MDYLEIKDKLLKIYSPLYDLRASLPDGEIKKYASAAISELMMAIIRTEDKLEIKSNHKSIKSALDINDISVQKSFPLTIDDNNVVTKNAKKSPLAEFAGSNIGYYYWREKEKDSDLSGPAEYTTIYYFETPGDLNKYLLQHPDKEQVIIKNIYSSKRQVPNWVSNVIKSN